MVPTMTMFVTEGVDGPIKQINQMTNAPSLFLIIKTIFLMINPNLILVSVEHG